MLVTATGTRITQAGANAYYQAVNPSDPPNQITADIYKMVRPENTHYGFWQNVMKFRKGQIVKTSELNAEFPPATVASLSPATGLAAGGTAVTIKGTNFGPGATGTIGGVAATSFVVVDDKTITCVSGAHAVGAVSAAVTTDSGTVTKATAFTYA
ncbi:MAG: hypothetical protein QOE54_1342 [Streptosporangiaceae bacterium]|nr:hypothetical protein [Streptosporangiaceae bacterium]